MPVTFHVRVHSKIGDRIPCTILAFLLVVSVALRFQPWIVRRTMVHEYFSRSWAMFHAAERTRDSGTAAMLVGLRFELAFKCLVVLASRCDDEPPAVHGLSDVLRKIPPLRPLLETLWQDDLDFVIRLMDEDINSSQIRYGSGGSRKSRQTGLLASAFATDASTWTQWTVGLYEELMGSLGATVWRDFPRTDRRGRKLHRRLEMHPAYAGLNSDESKVKSRDQPTVYPRVKDSVYGYLLFAVRDGELTDTGSVVPLGRYAREEYWARVRVARDTAVEVRIVQTEDAMHLTNDFRWIGRPLRDVHFTLHEALSVLSAVRPPAE